MQACNCGFLIPFEACPTCPPVEWLCPRCKETMWVKPTPKDEYDDVIRRFKERHKKMNQSE